MSTGELGDVEFSILGGKDDLTIGIQNLDLFFEKCVRFVPSNICSPKIEKILIVNGGEISLVEEMPYLRCGIGEINIDISLVKH